MIVKNKKKDNGMEIKDFVSNFLKNIKQSIDNVEFELTSDDGQKLNHKSINKVSFKVKRK